MEASSLKNYRLDYSVIKNISKQLGVCSDFIDLLDWRNYRGQRYLYQGRIFIPIQPKGNYIVIDKDHTTRYLVQSIIRTKVGLSNQEHEIMLAFQGFKYEKDKILIHGYFQLFQMKSYDAYIGFEEINLEVEEYHQLAGKDIYQQNGKAQLLFCKIATGEAYTKHYFDRQLQPIKKIEGQEHIESSQYFACEMSENSLRKLHDGEYVSTNTLNYFFNRLSFSYYSQLWIQKSQCKLFKVLPSDKMVSFFAVDTNYINYSFFHETLFNLDVKMGKSVFEEQKLIILPIFEHRKDHFVLGAIRKDSQTIEIYELDPLNSQGGTWRNRMQLLVKEHQRFLVQNGINSPNMDISIKDTTDSIQAPQQSSTTDCGIYVCLYALLLMQKQGFLKLGEGLRQKCKEKQGISTLIDFLRKIIYYSYKQRNSYFISSFQEGFNQSFGFYRSFY